MKILAKQTNYGLIINFQNKNYELYNDKKVKYYYMDDEYIVFERPYLQKFLDFIFKNFNVSIWTAASKEYASFILENVILVKPNRKIDYVFFSHHCNFSRNKYNCLKAMELLWEKYNIKQFNKKNTLLIDDLDETCNYNNNKNNKIIKIDPFNFSNTNYYSDNKLHDIKKYLKSYKKVKKNKNKNE
jgi:hypothetical protein